MSLTHFSTAALFLAIYLLLSSIGSAQEGPGRAWRQAWNPQVVTQAQIATRPAQVVQVTRRVLRPQPVSTLRVVQPQPRVVPVPVRTWGPRRFAPRARYYAYGPRRVRRAYWR